MHCTCINVCFSNVMFQASSLDELAVEVESLEHPGTPGSSAAGAAKDPVVPLTDTILVVETSAVQHLVSIFDII